MFQKIIGRQWSIINCNGIDIEMLWDSEASITMMDERNWRKIGSPKLTKSDIILAGVFST